MIHSKTLIIFILLISAIAFAFMTPLNFLINFAHDDSFFYIKTAYNFSQGFGSTFDQVNITNGYHPLWFSVLSLYFFILNFFKDLTPEYLFRFIAFLQFIISVSAMYFIYKIFNISKDDTADSKRFLLFIPLFIILVFTRDFGIESQLTCLIFSIYCYLKSLELFSGRVFTIGKSLSLCLIFLSRVDYLFSIIPFIIIFDYITSGKEFRNRFLVTSVLLISITALTYFIFNKTVYGYYLTISASSKNTFPEIIFFRNISSMISSRPMLIHLLKSICIFAAIIIFLFTRKSKDEKSAGMNLFLAGSCTGAFLFLILNFCFNTHALREWYVTFPAFAALILFIYSTGFSKKYFNLKFGALIMICSVYFYIARLNNFKWDSAYEYALNLKRVTGAEDRIFQIDYSGAVGFFSERKLINGDGLINSFEYRKYLEEGRLKDYFKDKKINLYSTHSEESGYAVSDSSGFYIDRRYSNKFGGYEFSFPEKQLLFTMPFYYDHSLSKISGEWYLFKIPD